MYAQKNIFPVKTTNNTWFFCDDQVHFQVSTHGPSFAYLISKAFTMIEKQSINGKDVWIEIEQQPANRSNPNIIPTEYFFAKYYLDETLAGSSVIFTDEDGKPVLFESPVAALTFARKKLTDII
jgi:hypothetical protein